jgi:hypothetical protein
VQGGGLKVGRLGLGLVREPNLKSSQCRTKVGRLGLGVRIRDERRCRTKVGVGIRGWG